MKREAVAYLPFLGIVLATCAASWLAGRTVPAGRTVVAGRTVPWRRSRRRTIGR